MVLRALSLAVVMALGLAACDKAEEPASPSADAQSEVSAMPSAPFADGSSDASSGAMADIQSAAMDKQDATAALTEAASAAVGMAGDTNSKK